jgi:gas vesicle protein
MNKDIMAVVGALVGVIVGGLITLFATYLQLRSESKQRMKERKIKAFEEIHGYLSILDHEAGYAFLQILDKIKHGNPINSEEMNKLPWQELEMRIGFYAPELENDLRNIKKEWEKLGRAFGLIIVEKYTSGEGPNELLDQSKKCSNKIEEQVAITKNKLSILVNTN